MRKIMGAMRRAIVDYDMISPGDRVAVGVSGGKDSMVLLAALGQLRTFIDIPFEIVALTIDPQFQKTPTDFRAVQALCDSLEIPYIIQKSELAEIIFDVRKEQNPCSLCSRMRRGILHGMVTAAGCNKLALGHHADDAVETFVMNLSQGGRLGTFQPVTYLSRRNITMIRPMLLLTEKQIEDAASRHQLPVIPSGCPVDGKTNREDIKHWLLETEQTQFPGFRKQIFGALRRSGLDGW